MSAALAIGEIRSSSITLSAKIGFGRRAPVSRLSRLAVAAVDGINDTLHAAFGTLGDFLPCINLSSNNRTLPGLKFDKKSQPRGQQLHITGSANLVGDEYIFRNLVIHCTLRIETAQEFHHVFAVFRFGQVKGMRCLCAALGIQQIIQAGDRVIVQEDRLPCQI